MKLNAVNGQLRCVVSNSDSNAMGDIGVSLYLFCLRHMHVCILLYASVLENRSVSEAMLSVSRWDT
ncbi:MAG: hypothetical protein GY928_09360 [Colwellia sp.]|nr:hypothetical protein [Colwellia sp.]